MKLISLHSLLLISVAGILVIPAAGRAQTAAGYVSLDETQPGIAEFDIVNETGPNSSAFPDTTFPISTTVTFSDLSLTVDFSGGGSETFGPSYFTTDLDGISFDGSSLSETSGPPSGLDGAVSATLTGVFDTTSLTLNDGSSLTIDPNFSATITDPSGGPLVFDGSDLAVIYAYPASTSTVTPEPASWMMVGTALLMLLGYRSSKVRQWLSSHFVSASLMGLCAITCLLCVLPAKATPVDPVKLNVATAPSSGLAGTTSVAVTGSGFPSGTITPANVNITLATTCGASGTSAGAISVVKVIGTSDKITFQIPSSLTTGNYFVSISGMDSSSTAFASTNCSEVQVTKTSSTLAACVPTSSLAVTVGTNVDAYVPFGYWDGGGTGIEKVPLEGTDTAANYATAGNVNSCAANSVTGEVVCTENGTAVDLIQGTSLTSITSGANEYAYFSGGACENCGVAINAQNNTAVIAMGVSGGTGSGVQVLNLASNTFNTAFPLSNYVSEDISIDSGRNLILSPGEGGTYDLLKIGSGNSLTEYGNYISPSYGEPDSAAEDCTTGIALSALEFGDYLYITDLTQASYASGTPGTWTAPGQFVDLSDGGYAAGTCGLSSAPSTDHLAVVTGEFGGSAYSALLLPSTSGSGTPTLADWAYVGAMPNTPDGYAFSAGYDPHTVTAYTSPNTGKSYAVFVDYYPDYAPSWLGVVDLSCVLAQPRTVGTHSVAGNASSCTRYVAVP